MEMEVSSVLVRLGIAVGIGLLVGLQRERAQSAIAGLRTFALTGMAGAVSALLAITFGGWVLAAAIGVVGAFVVMGNLINLRAGIQDPGLTTEVAVLLMFVLGAYLMVGRIEVGIVAGGALAVLLQFKGRGRRFVEWLGDRDVEAVMRFALITLVVLPVLPNQSYGPFDVLNPREIWLMVVLIVGIGLGGYLAYRVFGERGGSALSGLLGGSISSTATTVSYSHRGRDATRAPAAALVIMIASSVVFVRVLVEVAVVAPGSLPTVAPPVVLTLALFAGISVFAWWRHPDGAGPMPEQENPSELRPALVFGGLYGLILLAVAAGHEWLGAEGLYAIAAVSGLTDMDAITLSTAQLTRQGRVTADILWRVILVASLANLLFKLALIGFLGGRHLVRSILPYYAAGGAGIVAILLLWP
jgi:uncharacterized membrane protein (DUF4010 family)